MTAIIWSWRNTERWLLLNSLFIAQDYNGPPVRGWNIRHGPFYLPPFCLRAAAEWNWSCSLCICSASVLGVSEWKTIPGTWQWQTTRRYEARRQAAPFSSLLATSSGFGVVLVIPWMSETETLFLVFSSVLTLNKCGIIPTQVWSHLEQLALPFAV